MERSLDNRRRPVPRPPFPTLRHAWTADEAFAPLTGPFSDLLFQAQSLHRQNPDPNAIQISQLLSVKTGSCPEDCACCPQSARFDAGVTALGMETCATLGMLGDGQAGRPRGAGLDYNTQDVDTLPEVHDRVITKRTFEDRLGPEAMA